MQHIISFTAIPSSGFDYIIYAVITAGCPVQKYIVIILFYFINAKPRDLAKYYNMINTFSFYPA